MNKKKTEKSVTNNKKKSKNGFILNNDNIDINSVTYKEEDLKQTVEKCMGLYGFNINLERSFPNIKDGLKPVQRKVIYTGIESGYRSNKPFKKSLLYIGSGSRFYVHGNASFYGAMMSMAQYFYTKYPLIEVHGNCGSITGASYSAERYTESRLSKYAEDLTKDLSKESVNWKQNYDNSLEEPVVLPTTFPNLLLNGSYGIGLGYSASIPAHNFKDIIERTIKLIENPDISIDELIDGLVPDYPTGGVIINKKDLPNMYKTGSGTIRIRGKVTVTDDGNLLITSIPYLKNSGIILDSIQEAIKEGKINGISSLKDDTNFTNGIRITLVIKRGYDPKVIEEQLYKLTTIQDSISFQLICTDGLSFRYYNFKEILEEWIKFRKTTLRRLFNSKIAIIKKKIHIDEGLLIALDSDNIDNIIEIIKKAKDYDEIKQKLIKKYNLTEIQAEYISSLKLKQLCNMGKEEIEEDLKKLKEDLEFYIEFIRIPSKLNDYIIDELNEGVKKYDTPRLTEAIDVDLEKSAEAIIENTKHTLIITNQGFIKKIDSGKIKVQNVNGVKNSKASRGINIGKLKDDDYVISTINVENLDEVMFFTNKGRVFTRKVYEIKESNLNNYGILIETLFKLKTDEKIVTTLKVKKDDYKSEKSFLLFQTKDGLIKKTSLSLYSSVPKTGFMAIDLNDKDELVGVISSKFDIDVFVGTDLGNILRFNSDQIPNTKRITKGVKSVALIENENVISFDILENNESTILVLTNKGNSKRVKSESIRISDRNKKGNVLIRLVDDEKVVSVMFVNDDDELTIITTKKIIKVPVIQIPILVKNNIGRKIISLLKSEKVLTSNI